MLIACLRNNCRLEKACKKDFGGANVVQSIYKKSVNS